MSLFSALGSSSRALDAQRFGLEVAGQNIANVNTPGYSRREVQLAESAPTDRLSAGNGVDIAGMRSVRDQLLERRLRQERPPAAREQAIADSLSMVEVALGSPGKSLDANLTAFFDSFATLADDPTSATGRQGAVLQGTTLASAFHDMANRLVDAQRDANNRVRASVDEVNSLSARIASLNDAIGAAGGNTGQASTLQDEQGELVRRLSELVDVSAIQRTEGGLDVSLGNGSPLAVGNKSYALTATPQAPNGFYAITDASGFTVTATITGGSVAGQIKVRDTLIPNYQTQLDTLAFTMVSQVNTIEATAFDANGAAAPNFFTPLGSSAGAAAAIAVNPAVVANSALVGAADATGAAGNNNAARAISALRNARVLNGGQATFADSWAQLMYQAGSDVQTAQAQARSRAEIVRQVQTLRDGVSGVSLDEEAMQMLKFQRAYEANAKFFQTVDYAISVLLSLKQ